MAFYRKNIGTMHQAARMMLGVGGTLGHALLALRLFERSSHQP